MCRFISIAVENVEEAKRLFAGYTVWANENKSFKSELPPQFGTLWVTDGHCSCDFYSDPYDPENEAQKLRKRFSKLKYKKKGWSEERIEREVKQILGKPKQEGGLSSLLFSCIQHYTKNIGSCYFHVGWYDGDQTKQGLRIVDYANVSINSGSVNASDIDEDVLYKFS
jgi:hypothetical protein